MSNVKKTLQMTSLLFGMTLLFCYIGWHLGYEGFIIVGDITVPYWTRQVVSFMFLLINLSLQGGFALDEYGWKILRYSIPLTVLDAVAILVFGAPNAIFSGPVPLLFFMFLAIKKDKRLWWRPLAINAGVIIYQIVASIFTQTPLSNASMYTVFRMSIDNGLVHLLFYMMGGVKYHGLEQLVFPGRAGDDRDRHEHRQTDSKSPSDVPVGKFETWVMRVVITSVQVIQWVFILWICSLDNLFLDALVMTTSFICHGLIISRRQHLRPIILCTLAATAMFYFAARFTLSFQYSQFFPIVIGLLLTYTMYRVSYQIELAAQAKAEEDLRRITKLEREMDAAWKCLDELL